MGRKSVRKMWADKVLRQTPGRVSYDPPPAARQIFRGTVLGVDPSLRGTGLAILEVKGPYTMKLVHSETLKLKPAVSSHRCLGRIAQAVAHLCSQHEPVAAAFEETIYVNNFRTAQIMGMARGAAVAPAVNHGCEIFEYAPLRIKQAVVGYGRASKEQMSAQIRSLLKLAEDLPFDQADAAGVAICHALSWKG